MKTIIKIIIAFIIVGYLFLFGLPKSIGAQETPWVNDETNLLTHETLDGITYLNETVFVDYDIQPQLAVEVLNDYPEGYSDIDSYRVDRFNSMGVGGSEHDSGILLIMVLNERQFAIETGYGVEPTLTDLEAGRILSGEMTDYLKQYSETGDGEYLNHAVNQSVNEIADVLERGNTGVLFEEREAEEAERLRKEEESARRLAKWGKAARGLFSALIGGAAIMGVSKVSHGAYQNYKRRKHIESLRTSFKNHYDQHMNTLYKKELSFEDFWEIFYAMYVNKDDVRLANGFDLDDLIEKDKDHIFKYVRYLSLTSILENHDLKYPINYYETHGEIYLEQSDNDSYSVGSFIQSMDKQFDAEMVKYNHAKEQVLRHVATYIQNLELPRTYDVKRLTKEIAENMMKRVGVTAYNVQHLSIEKPILEGLDPYIEQEVKEEIIERTIREDNELNGLSFTYGSKNAFVKEAKKRLASTHSNYSVKDLVGGVVLTQLLYSVYQTYIEAERVAHKKAARERERQRRLREKRRKEERQRSASSLSSSSSFGSSSSSSSRNSGGFGSGFGGGRSGGGGASGGW